MAVDDHDLAVIAQVGPAETTLVQLEGQHEMPIHANLRQAFAQ